MPWAWQALVLAVILAAAVALVGRRPQFEVVVRGGRVVRTRGTVSRRFREDCELICAAVQIERVRIAGLLQSGRLTLRFRPRLPAACEQRLRNAWSVHA